MTVDTNQPANKIRAFYGDGRGKTSAAMGEALLATSAGLKACAVFFMKGPRKGAEYQSLTDLGVPFAIFGRSGFLSGKDTLGEDKKLAREAVEYARRQMESGGFDLLVLDEINNAEYYGLISETDILDLLSARPKNMSLILTGMKLPEKIAAVVDEVCQFRKIKHPYDKGIKAMRGVDF
ncbi:MAG: cob(I)yrinic acid a,c-diamide adenosyltransferase [Dehalogenimonas sp.]